MSDGLGQTVLNDIFQTMAVESETQALIENTLQRLIFHTSSDCGLFLNCHVYQENDNASSTMFSVCLESVCGYPSLESSIGNMMNMPQGLLSGRSRFLDFPALWKGVDEGLTGYPYALLLPDFSQGFFILFFSELPKDHRLYEGGFDLVLTNFGRLLRLCRLTEKKECRDQAEITEESSCLCDETVTLLVNRTEELRLANAELDALCYSVSHDLSAPLRSISGFSDILVEDYSDQFDAEGRDYLFRVQDSCKRMSSMITDLLRLSRMTRTELHRTDVDLSGFANQISERLSVQDPERMIDWEIEPGLMVNADERMAIELLEKLLDNAFKFTTNQRQARIEIGRHTEAEKVVYFIRDNGVGFDMQFVGKLFTPFERLHSTDEFPGNGIGLAIVQRIILRHGGSVWAESIVGKNTVFFFTFE